MSPINPYQATAEVSSDPFVSPRTYGGIGRGAYVASAVGVGVLQNILQDLARSNMGPSAGTVASMTSIISLGLLIWVTAQRMINQGSSGWWGIGVIIPILNLFVAMRCLICPEGFADHRTLDTIGKVIGGLLLGLILLILVAVF